MTTDSSKDALRQLAFKSRLKIPADVRAEASRRAMENFLAHVALPPAGAVISGYCPVNNEIDVAPLLRQLIALGYHCCVPQVIDKESRLAFLRWGDDVPMRVGLYDIPEPDPRHAIEMVPDLLIVPMLAFDAQGHRLGYGSGNFDRTFAGLAKIKPFRAVGFAYEAQKYDSVPVGVHDYDMEMIVTDKNIYVPERKQA